MTTFLYFLNFATPKSYTNVKIIKQSESYFKVHLSKLTKNVSYPTEIGKYKYKKSIIKESFCQG